MFKEIICSKTGIKFQAKGRGRPPTTHPEIAKILTEAYNFGWYTVAMETINKGREQGFTSIEQFIKAIREAERNTHHSRYPKFMYEKGKSRTPRHIVLKRLSKEQ